MHDLDGVLFKDFIRLQRGFDLPHKKRINGNYPVVAATSIHGHHNEYKVMPPGVTTGRSGALGKVLYIKEPFWPLNTVLWIKDFKGNLPNYVYYFLKTLDLAQYNSGVGVPTLNRNHLDNIQIKVHKLEDQRKIAAVLSAYDDLIENNLRRIKILEEMAKLIYREWFVKFRFPGHEKVKMVDSELGKIPEGWKIKKIGDISKVHRGRSYRSRDLAEKEGLPFVNLKCIEREGGFRLSGMKRYDGPFKDTQIVNPSNIVIAVTDMTQERRIVARAARVPDFGEQTSVFSMDLVKVVPGDANHSNFLYGVLRFSSFPDEVKQYANGANVLHLNPDKILGYSFPLPPGNLRDIYSKFADAIYKECDVLSKKNDTLRKTRDLLLPKLISGELDVSELDIDMGEKTK